MIITKQKDPDHGFLYHTANILGFMLTAESDESARDFIRKSLPIAKHLEINFNNR